MIMLMILINWILTMLRRVTRRVSATISHVDDGKVLQHEFNEKPVYAFCESIYAGSHSRWHIRKLDDAGLKLGGGVTTMSLCGHVRRGWDLKERIRPSMLAANQDVACKECVALYKDENHVD